MKKEFFNQFLRWIAVIWLSIFTAIFLFVVLYYFIQ